MNIEVLSLVAQDIVENPSQLHCKCKHKDAPQTPDFDWNVFVGRIDSIIEQEKIHNSPARKCRLAIAALEADLTHDNRSMAKKLLKEASDTFDHDEKRKKFYDAENRQMAEEDKELFSIYKYIPEKFDWLLNPNPNKPKRTKRTKRTKVEHPLEWLIDSKPKPTKVETPRKTDTDRSFTAGPRKISVLNKEEERYANLLSSFVGNYKGDAGQFG